MIKCTRFIHGQGLVVMDGTGSRSGHGPGKRCSTICVTDDVSVIKHVPQEHRSQTMTKQRNKHNYQMENVEHKVQ